MNTYTFTAEQLRQLLSEAITEYAGDGYMSFSERARTERSNAIDRIMANTLPTQLAPVSEDEIFQAALLEEISKNDGVLLFVSDDDNISPAAIGLEPEA